MSNPVGIVGYGAYLPRGRIKVEEIAEVWEDRWFGLVVGISELYTPADVEGLALVDYNDELAGLVTYHVDGPAGQIVTLDTILRGRGFGRQLLEAAENKFHNVNVNCILPGTIDTPQNRQDMADADFSHWVPPAALDDVVLFLASNAARCVTGAAVPVYGQS